MSADSEGEKYAPLLFADVVKGESVRNSDIKRFGSSLMW